MRFVATVESDIGIVKSTNQDSVLLKHASSAVGEVLMAAICDGMGGLSKGELASKTVILEFAKWFDEELPFELKAFDPEVVAGKWVLMLKDLNHRIGAYGKQHSVELGTTFTGVLFVGDEYVCVHVGDTRLYYIADSLSQLTEDQTYIAREIKSGRMTPEEAKVDKRRNVLLQCIGASQSIVPQTFHGRTDRGIYLLCSDGFRHELTEQELLENLAPINLVNKKAMHANAEYLIERVKSRRERDNISVVLIKAD